ncbi:Putative Zinc finger, PHD-type, Zinc finger, FYVE/PHD-type, Zinc finger, RING/FYVE/PHD-type [Septoria linicola]|uniref:Zinc finger, PHD-type, Zinc finger, FYVE/PHD-type, Zinc finger, RING/FYVE/PHD-type n=1 Tax=Septoria linicola TaxID=215465 RepID=A0A9Q9ARI3_9PEZI|nr:putative Zinc finger, PHD-type, Zinc finger, FYVE/PHD-type, Zinc finger, RING/FYVE/PHD-type [Septoria linicola]USW50721.1 Putative Zinc finger, PHD-type, Zinc finger, FYVE/PHD-type, Zinc finger, RING/FYVE/PHD-type [Septoria linicola]
MLSSPSQSLPEMPLLNGRRSKRVTTQAATAASQRRVSPKKATSPPSGGSIRRTSRLQTELRASDPKLQDNFSRDGADIDHTDEEGLRFAGYRGNRFFEALDRDCAGGRVEFCVCKSVASGKDGGDVDIEELVRCSVRDCKPGWFHLECVGLPDHPPMRLGWMCPDCILSQGMTTSVQGLWDMKHGEDLSRVKRWLKESRQERREAQQRAATVKALNELWEDDCGQVR